jgi:hypothetical protein
MAVAQQTGLILRDEQGQYYLITTELLDSARVPDEQASVLTEAVGDVSGFITPIPIPDGQLGSLSLLGTVKFSLVNQAIQFTNFSSIATRG